MVQDNREENLYNMLSGCSRIDTENRFGRGTEISISRVLSAYHRFLKMYVGSISNPTTIRIKNDTALLQDCRYLNFQFFCNDDYSVDISSLDNDCLCISVNHPDDIDELSCLKTIMWEVLKYQRKSSDKIYHISDGTLEEIYKDIHSRSYISISNICDIIEKHIDITYDGLLLDEIIEVINAFDIICYLTTHFVKCHKYAVKDVYQFTSGHVKNNIVVSRKEYQFMYKRWGFPHPEYFG